MKNTTFKDMVKYSKKDISSFDSLYRLNLINSISGFKPANLIGTANKNGKQNLAIFSSVVHLGTNPALLGFFLRANTTPGHTYKNILETGAYTINHVPENMVENAHYTSAKFEDSEFEQCDFTPIQNESFHAPYVAESSVRIGLKHVDSVSIKANNTILVIGEVQELQIEKGVIKEDGMLRLDVAGSVTVSGLNSYYATRLIKSFPYAKPEENPFGS